MAYSSRGRRRAPPPGQAKLDFEGVMDRMREARAANDDRLRDAQMLGEAGMVLAEKGAGDGFTDRAQAFALKYLERVPHSSTELITDACKLAGIVPKNDDRAFGPVYAGLLRKGAIVKIGDCKRRKGHGTAGGSIVALASKWPNATATDTAEVAA